MIIIHVYVQHCGLLQCVRNTCFLIVFHFLSATLGQHHQQQSSLGPFWLTLITQQHLLVTTQNQFIAAAAVTQTQQLHSSATGHAKGNQKPLQSVHIRCSLVVVKDYTLIKKGF